MSGATLALVAADVRRSPVRLLGGTAAIVVAGALAQAGTIPLGAGGALSAAITWAICTAASESRQRMLVLLGGSGARRRSVLAFGLAAGLLPGALAFPILLAVFAFGGAGSILRPAALLGLAIPALTGLLATAAAPEVGTPAGPARRRWGTAVVLAAAVASAALVQPLALLALPAILAAAVSRSHRVLRTALALSLIVGATVLIGSSDSWIALLVTLVVGGPAAAMGIALLSTLALDGAVATSRRASLGAHLAVSGLARNRRVVAPLVATLAVAAAALTINGVVAASFGEREARRLHPLSGFAVEAGTGPGQSVAQAFLPDPADAATARREAGHDRDVVIVGIDEVLDAVPPTGQRSDEVDQRVLLALVGHRSLLSSNDGNATVEVPGGVGPVWVGVATPADLTRLGLPEAAVQLAAGRAVIFNGLVPDGPVDLLGATGPVRLEGRRAQTGHVATSFPAVVVTPAVGRRLGPATRLRTVVAVAAPRHHPTQAQLDRAAGTVADAGFDSASAVELTGRSSPLADLTEQRRTPSPGDERISLADDGALNAVPVFGHTRRDATRSLLPMALLTMLLTAVVVAFLLGSSRGEAEVLELQGASGWLRSRVAAMQAVLLVGSASVLGLVLGSGMVLGAIARYNGANRSLTTIDIPVVVPWIVPATLLVLPLASALLSSLVVTLRPPSTPSDLADRLDGLAG